MNVSYRATTIRNKGHGHKADMQPRIYAMQKSDVGGQVVEAETHERF